MRSISQTCRQITVAGCIALTQICPTAVIAQETAPHLEKCTVWSFNNDRFVTINNCTEPVTIQFMLMSNQNVVYRDVKPGEVFDTGLSSEAFKNSGWLFTTCPVGYSPSVEFLLKNKDVILPSKYECVKK